jgi:hypothetical protein
MPAATIEAPVKTTRMQQLQFDGVKVALSDEQLRPPGENEVRIRSEFTHVSIGTEIAYIDKYTASKQATGLGYSNVGVIEELGANVRGLKIGQRVFNGLGHAAPELFRHPAPSFRFRKGSVPTAPRWPAWPRSPTTSSNARRRNCLSRPWSWGKAWSAR